MRRSRKSSKGGNNKVLSGFPERTFEKAGVWLKPPCTVRKWAQSALYLNARYVDKFSARKGLVLSKSMGVSGDIRAEGWGRQWQIQ